MTREFKVGDRVVGTDDALHHRRGAPGVVTEVLNNGWLVDWENFPTENHYVMHGELTHAEPVPIGYTGKLRDMDLQEGDVVRICGERNVFERVRDHTEPFAGEYEFDMSIIEGDLEGTLISRANRANTTPPDQWSDWQLSRKDGYMAQQYAEVQTVPLDDTQQVVYRGRGVAPEKASHLISVGHKQYYVTTIDGQPDWSTVEDADAAHERVADKYGIRDGSDPYLLF